MCVVTNYWVALVEKKEKKKLKCKKKIFYDYMWKVNKGNPSCDDKIALN